jgi:hypothetical protein
MRLRTIVGALSFTALAIVPALAEASSHREAPFVSKNPKVDGTDFYAFESYEAGHTGMVTFIANYQPLQDAFGAPNYFPLDNDALYEIEIDNNGDGVEDWTFQFQFQTALNTSGPGYALQIGPSGAQKTVAVPFYNVGLIPTNADGTGGNSGALNVLETYTADVIAGPRRGPAAAAAFAPSTGGTTFNKPADNVGVKSFGLAANVGVEQGGTQLPAGDYAAYANTFIYSGVTFPGCTKADASSVQIFVGQRAESFAVNLGPVFDLVDAPAALVTGGGVAANYGAVPNPIGKKNVTTIAIEVPRDCIWESAAQPVIGAWTTAAVRQARVVNPNATYAVPSVEGGAWTTVSRLGNPLVNEVVIGTPDKDFWNTTEPSGDVANFANYVEYPTLPAIIDAVYGTDLQPTVFPRTDLVAAFLTGLAPVNSFTQADGGVTVAPAETVHLNTNTEGLLATLGVTGITPTPYTPKPAHGAWNQTQNRLGAALCTSKGSINTASLSPYAPATSCDPFGFPNGRRPIDDVIDLALDVVEGFLLPSGAPAYATTPIFFTDGVDQGATPFLATFPYLSPPTPGANGDGT